MANTCLRYAVSMGLILICLMVGHYIQIITTTSIPSSIIGMLLLFFLLASGLVSAKWVRPSANLLIRYMVLLFVPISVGLMQHFDMLINNALPILASAIGGTFIVIVVLGLLLEKLLKGGGR
ncbi:CidA/LrgA family protein [Vibrio ostreicida]|uniref:CidA/LrgA family protein n=1 Tax=Vibrio ostreicida TaxID=526588 RepID=A0ABT8BVJ8_9VIBR|nr:CidA/LrgA family protein [Vibrio ostreicida]MDN3610160.1 CidA/LrgA family protein [Vibrio ostreicida]NPD07819.1 CidA/LrgA family protein [Vibrio ostreicida]